MLLVWLPRRSTNFFVWDYSSFFLLLFLDSFGNAAHATKFEFALVVKVAVGTGPSLRRTTHATEPPFHFIFFPTATDPMRSGGAKDRRGTMRRRHRRLVDEVAFIVVQSRDVIGSGSLINFVMMAIRILAHVGGGHGGKTVIIVVAVV